MFRLPVITPPVTGAASAVNNAGSHQLDVPQQTPANPRPAPNVTSAGYNHDQTSTTSLPPAKPTAQPMPPLPHTESTQPLGANNSMPVAFTRLSRDGTPVGRFDPQAGNFSPLAGNRSDKVDYNKSAKVFRNNIQPSKAPFNNSDAQNRMPQSPAEGPGPGNRMIGCPPGRPVHNPSLHARANSGPSTLGVKRGAQGQYVRYAPICVNSMYAMINFEVVMRDASQIKLNHRETLDSKDQGIL